MLSPGREFPLVDKASAALCVIRSGYLVLTVYISCVYQRFYDQRHFCFVRYGTLPLSSFRTLIKRGGMIAKDWQERRGTSEECPDVSRTKAHERQTGRFKLATIVAALNAATILLASGLKLGFLTVLGLFALALLFYIALILSIYVFHKPARWAFLGILDSLILAYAVHWIH
jgi:hypothetical protein